MTTPTPLSVARQVRPAITKLYVTYFRISERSNLSGPQVTILTRLHMHGPMRISHIAREEGLRMPTVSNALHQLQDRGLVRRLPDPHDRRGVLVELTEDGHGQLQRVSEERDAQLADMLAVLSPDDLAKAQEFADVINRLADSYTVSPAGVDKERRER